MSHDERAINMVQESMDNILGRKTMSNLSDDVTDKMVSDAGEAIPATDDEVIAFVKKSVPKATEVDTIDWDGGDDVQVGFWLKRGDIGR